MDIIKPIGIFIKEKKFLVARDRDEDFFKNVGGRILNRESDFECLKRTLKTDLGYDLSVEPEFLFELPPTDAVGDPGNKVVLKAYLITKETNDELIQSGDVSEIAWINSTNYSNLKITPQIKDLIVPKLVESGLIS